MSSAPKSYNTHNPDFWQKSAVKKTARGSKQVYVNMPNSRQSPKFLLPKMTTPFGARPPKEGNGRPAVDVSVEDPEFLSWLTNLDDHNVRFIAEHSMEIFNTQEPRPLMMVQQLNSAMAKRSDKYPDYPPLLRVKINEQGRSPTQILVVQSGSLEEGDLCCYPGSLEDVREFSTVQIVARAEGYWFIQSNSGFTLSASTILVWPDSADETDEFNGMQVVDRPAAVEAPGPEPDATVLAAAGASGESVTFIREGDDSVSQMEE